MRPILSVHGYITGLVFATVLPFLVFSGLLVYRTATTEQALVASAIAEAANTAAGNINRRVLSLVSLAQTIADARLLQISDFAGFHARWSREARREHLRVILYDLNGQELVDTSVPYGTDLPADPDMIAHTAVTGEIEITNLTRDHITGQNRVAINVPVRRGDELAYILSLWIEDALAATIAEGSQPNHVATLFDLSHIVLARSRDHDRFVGALASPDLPVATAGRESGNYNTRSLEGVPIYVAFRRVEATGWILAEAIPESVLYAIATRSLDRLLALAVCMIILAGIAAWAIGHSIGGAVSRLSRLAAAPDTDQLDGPPLQTNILEVNEVAASIHAASAALRRQAEQRERVNAALQVEIVNRQRAEQQLVQAQKMEALGQLTGGIAHDFNNLLAIIIGSLEILRPHWEADPRTREFGEEAMKAAVHGSELISQMLAFARRQPLVPKRNDINAVIRDFARLLARVLGSDIVIELELTEGLPQVLVDPVQLEATITNLAMNARHAMPNGGKLTISTRDTTLDEEYAATHVDVAPGDYVLIEVSDTGTGMPPEVLHRIFEPFFTTKSPGKGTGLGLAMVFGFLKQSGGHISVHSAVGEGTTFRLYLPHIPDDASWTRTDDAAATRGGRGETILAAEKSPGSLRTMASQLTEAGYRVLTAANGQAALDIIAGNDTIDLLLTDVTAAGGLTAKELAERAHELRPGLKILMTSGPPFAPGEARTGSPRPLPARPYRKDDFIRIVQDALKA